MDRQEFQNYLDKKNKENIIFDFDSTICKLKINWKTWYKEVTDLYHKYDPSYEEKDKKQIELDQNSFIKRFGKEFYQKLIKFQLNYEKKYYQGYLKNNSLIEFIKKNKNKRLFLWTSNHSDTVKPILKKLEINKSFTKKIFKNTVLYIKPSSEGFNLINQPKKPNKSYLMVGDSIFDQQAAKNSKIDFLKITYFKKID